MMVLVISPNDVVKRNDDSGGQVVQFRSYWVPADSLARLYGAAGGSPGGATVVGEDRFSAMNASTRSVASFP
jgi:hypothetical protein